MDEFAKDDAAEAAALEAAFLGQRITPEENPEENPKQAEPQEVVEPKQEETPAELAVEPPRFAGYTEDDIRASMERLRELDSLKSDIERIEDRSRKAFSKYGELDSKIKALRSAGTGLSPNAKKNLSEQFPELADILFGKEGETPPPPPPAPEKETQPEQSAVDVTLMVEERVKSETERLTREMEKKVLTAQHRDWEVVVRSPEFVTWSTTVLSEADAQQLSESWDGLFIADKLTEFKQWRKEKAEASQDKTKRLEAAVTERGIPRTASGGADIDEEEEAMMKAYRPR